MKWGTRAFGLLAIATAIAWLALHGAPDGRLHVYFLDVGQGDAIFIQAPDGRQVLVDGGPSPGALLTELGTLLPFWDRRLDLVVLTHPDADHMAGLIPLLERYRVERVLDTRLSDRSTEAQPWCDALQAAAVERVYAEAGMLLRAGEVTLTVLAATADGLQDDNTGSVVLRLDYGETAMLLTGDADMATEMSLLASGARLHANVLKVGHHGSNHSSSAAFLAAVRPSLAVIQVGAGNSFGHPHSETLARLSGSRVLRTDQQGRIEITGDGRQLWVKTER